MDTVNRAGGVVVWIGLPITRSEAQTQRVRRDQRDRPEGGKGRARARRSSSTPTRCSRATTADSPSTWRTTRGDTVKVRAGDGVHFDTAGGDMIAREVLKQLNMLFDLTSWRKQKPA